MNISTADTTKFTHYDHDGLLCHEVISLKAGSTLAANSRGVKRFLTPSLAACRAHTRGWCVTPCDKTRPSSCIIKPVRYMLTARRGKNASCRKVAHQAARRVFLVGVKNRLMPRELAASVLPSSRCFISPGFSKRIGNVSGYMSNLKNKEY
jgi:hypothetical protein